MPFQTLGRLACLFALTFILSTGCNDPQVSPGAQTPSPPINNGPPPQARPARTVSVSGTAVINTAPDEFIISVGVDTFDLKVQAAKATNDAIMAELIALSKSHDVADIDIRTTGFSIRPRHESAYNSNRRTLLGYDVQKGLSLTLRTPESLEIVLTQLFERGANRLDGIDFRSSKTVEKRWEARELAVEAAHKKAKIMAEKLGQDLGEPLEIVEGQQPSWGSGPGNFSMNMVLDNDTIAQVGETFASGKVQVRASVSVVFEMKGR